MRDWTTRRLLLTHLLSVVGEWAVIVGILVHAFAWGGAATVGVVSLIMLIPPLSSAPIVGAAQMRWRTHAIRRSALLMQVVLFGTAALLTAAGAATPFVAAPVLGGLTAMMLIPPTTVALLPQVVRSADGLVRANLWVSHCDSASGFVGPLAAGVVVATGGVPMVFAAAAAGSAIGLLATVWRVPDHVVAARSGVVSQPTGVVRRTIAELRSNSWGRGVLVLLCARNLMLGSFDVLLVILALESLDMGEGGPGYLGALVGAGALASTLITTLAVRRARLRASLMTAVTSTAFLAFVLGVRIERPIVFVVLPVIGLAIAVIDGLSRALLVRVTDPRSLAPMYASLAFVAGIGQLAGSALAQSVLWFNDVRFAFLAVGAVLVVLAGFSVRSLREADEHANIPVVEMSLLSGLPLLAALPATSLERVARSAETLEVAAGDTLMSEGETAESCYFVAEGEFTVSMSGRHVGRVSRGEVVGEVALLSRLTPRSTVVASTKGTVLRVEGNSFLSALTGRDMGAADVVDFAGARHRLRAAVAAHEHFATKKSTGRVDTWLGLGAAGRMLGEPTFVDALAQTAELAIESGNDAAVAEAAALATWPGAFFFVADNPDQDMIELCERALVGLDRDDPVRVRVLATLASNLAFADTIGRRSELIEEAHELARMHDDEALVAAVLNAEFISMWEPDTFDRRAEIGSLLARLGERLDDPELLYVGRFFTAFSAAERGQLEAARQGLTSLRGLASQLDHEYFEFLSERLLLAIDIAQGCPGVRERIDALAERHADTFADTAGTWALQHGGLAYEAGVLGDMVPTISAMLDGPHARTWSAGLALAYVMAGDHDAAAAVGLDHENLPRSYFWLTATQTHAEVVSNLGDLDRCSYYFEELLPYRGQVGITASGTRVFGLVSRTLGDLAVALGRHEVAIELLEEAVAAADSMGLVFEGVISRRLLARALLATGADDRAAQIADAASAVAADRGYKRELDLLVAVGAG